MSLFRLDDRKRVKSRAKPAACRGRGDAPILSQSPRTVGWRREQRSRQYRDAAV